MSRIFSLLVFLAGATGYPFSSSPTCKESHLTAGWPPHHVWAELNATAGGKLLAPLPPAVACDPDAQEYDPAACEAIDQVWSTANFANADPVTVHQANWQHDACLPPSIYNGSDRCDVAPFAKYVVNASNARHAVEAVRFASERNLRLSLKNTGHDYLGRSTSPGFQLWTHYLKGLEIHDDFRASGCAACSGTPAMTIGAGSQYGEIYNFSAEHGVVINGGEEPSVGFGGHMTGGGHSPLGSLYGLLVDNVLEVQMVTPTGELIIANECQHQDLFWATRGGGGSTFGVLISATVRTHRNLPAATFGVTFGSTQEEAVKNNNSNFYSVLSDMFAKLVHWSDSKVNGYMYFGPSFLLTATASPTEGIPETPATSPYPYSLLFGGHGLNQTAAELNRTMSAFADVLNHTEGVEGEIHIEEVSRTIDLLRRKTSASAGANVYLGSRLWDKAALLDREGLITTLRRMEPNLIQGLAVSGPAVRDEGKIPLTSVTPTWRQTYLHILSGTSLPYRNSTAQAEAREQASLLRDVLAARAPHMGAYLNEGDRDQPDPGKTFWGDNYGRLLRIKRRYDPHGTFWCKPCVGFEDWEMDEETGRLCRVRGNGVGL